MCQGGRCWAVAGPSSQRAQRSPEKDNSPWDLSNSNPALFAEYYRSTDINELPTDFQDLHSFLPPPTLETGRADRPDSGYESSIGKGKGKEKVTHETSETFEHLYTDHDMIAKTGAFPGPGVEPRDAQGSCRSYGQSKSNGRAWYPEQGRNPTRPDSYTSRFRERFDVVRESTQGKMPEEVTARCRTAIPLRFTRDLPEAMGTVDTTYTAEKATLHETGRHLGEAASSAETHIDHDPKHVSFATVLECPPYEPQPKSIRKRLREHQQKLEANIFKRLRRWKREDAP